MDAVREWAVSLCAAAVLCAAAGMLAPEDKQGKCFRTVLSAVMLCLMISPLSRIKECSGSTDGYTAVPEQTGSELFELVERQTADAMSASVSNLVGHELDELGVSAREIYVVMDISQDGCISIGQVTVALDGSDADRAGEVRSRLYAQLGLDAEITVMEE